MDETPVREMNYAILAICRQLKGSISYNELQEIPLPGLYEISHNLHKIMTEESRNG